MRSKVSVSETVLQQKAFAGKWTLYYVYGIHLYVQNPMAVHVPNMHSICSSEMRGFSASVGSQYIIPFNTKCFFRISHRRRNTLSHIWSTWVAAKFLIQAGNFGENFEKSRQARPFSLSRPFVFLWSVPAISNSSAQDFLSGTLNTLYIENILCMRMLVHDFGLKTCLHGVNEELARSVILQHYHYYYSDTTYTTD